MGSRKLLAFDIDGTILDSNKRPLPSTLEALDALRKAGHFVTLATGRSRFLAESVIRELQFENYILCNGAAGFFNHQQVFKETLDQQALTTLIEVCQARGIDTAIVQLDQSKRLSSFDLEKMQDAMTSFGSTASELGELAHDDEVYQALAYYEKDCDPLFEGQHPAFNFVRWHEKCVDVIPANGSKARTLLALAERLGIDRADIIGFGDGLNDISMIDQAPLGIAMGNAIDEVKVVANFITKRNDDDGIEYACRHFGWID